MTEPAEPATVTAPPEPWPEHLDDHRGVRVRRWRRRDALALEALIAGSIEHLRPWMPWIAAEPLGLDQRAALLISWEHDWEAGGDFVCAIERDGAVCGSAGLHRRRGPGRLEIGYWLAAGAVGRGTATRAAALLADHALARADTRAVEILHDVANHASEGVPRRLGFVRAGELHVTPEAPAETGVRALWRRTL